ncbi:MAG: hypothetical protein JW791_04040 [Nanoarchaeota archaeon]|nr:hypothetical protein [Nanoarchaeota archaeon]
MVAKKKTAKKTAKKKTATKSSVNKEIKALKEQLDVFKSQMRESSSAKLEQNIEDLSEQLNKMVSININLQSKMTELLIKVTDLIRENRELISLLEEASSGEEEEGEANKAFDSEIMLVELKKIEKNTSDLTAENVKLNDYIKRMYTKSLLSKAIKGKVESSPKKEEEEPVEEEEETPLPFPEEANISGL